MKFNPWIYYEPKKILSCFHMPVLKFFSLNSHFKEKQKEQLLKAQMCVGVFHNSFLRLFPEQDVRNGDAVCTAFSCGASPRNTGRRHSGSATRGSSLSAFFHLDPANRFGLAHRTGLNKPGYNRHQSGPRRRAFSNRSGLPSACHAAALPTICSQNQSKRHAHKTRRQSSAFPKHTGS